MWACIIHSKIWHVALGQGIFFPHTPDWCRALPSHIQILVSLGLTNSSGLTLITPRDTTQPQSSAGTQWVTAGLHIPWNICWVASDTAPAPSLHLYQSGEHHSPLSGESLRTYLRQLKYCQRLFQWLSLTSSQQMEARRGRQRRIFGYLGNFPDLFLDLVLVKSGLGAQLGPFHAQPDSH